MNNTFRVWSTAGRVDTLVKNMGDKISVIETDSDNPDYILIDIQIKDNIDILDLFHAGIDYGINKLKSLSA
jgi:hypothetical protein